VKRYISAISALALMTGAAPAMAQTVPYSAANSQTAAVRGPAPMPAPQTDPNAPHWMLLEGYGGGGQLHQQWYLVRPQDFDASNYHGFHTGTQ
jgi:hypothetical protein